MTDGGKTLVVLLGPTGVGKTELCLTIAEHMGVPIINADSRQIYAELPIGTAAPTKEQRRRVKHYFVGSLHLTDYYSASMYEMDVTRLLASLFKGSDTALLSGGSMMYIDAVCNGIDDIPSVDSSVRKMMKQRYEVEGIAALRDELARLDPEYYSVVDKNNPKRIIHALEICHTTSRTYTSFRTHKRKQRPFRILKIGISRERAELYDRINSRVDTMMAEGLVDEARKVYPLRGINALNTVGYKELFEHFDGKCTLDYATERIRCDTRRYCRKQLTWFRRDKEINWMRPENVEEIINYICRNT